MDINYSAQDLAFRDEVRGWLDKNIPDKYRKSVADGILEWNKAFEKAGFRNAIVAKDAPTAASSVGTT